MPEAVKRVVVDPFSDLFFTISEEQPQTMCARARPGTNLLVGNVSSDMLSVCSRAGTGTAEVEYPASRHRGLQP